MQEPSIFTYLDYRAYLKDRYTYLKTQNSKYSYRYIAKKAGFSSSSSLKLVMDGKRNLSESSIDAFATALKIEGVERKFFTILVKFNQAKLEQDKSLYLEKLSTLRKAASIRVLGKESNDYLSNLVALVVREMAALPSFEPDPEKIHTKLINRVTIQEVRSAIDLLVSQGLIQKNLSGQLKQQKSQMTTPPEVDCSQLYRLYFKLLSTAQDTLEDVPSHLRDFSALIAPMNRAQIKKLKEMIYDFRQQILNFINTSDRTQPFEEVYSLNLNLFPLTKMTFEPVEKKDKKE